MAQYDAEAGPRSIRPRRCHPLRPAAMGTALSLSVTTAGWRWRWRTETASPSRHTSNWATPGVGAESVK